jgi:hypothetical protein
MICQQGVDYYDRLHSENNIPEARAIYYPLLRKVVGCIQDRNSRSILEV